MKTHETKARAADFAVRAQGKGFYYAVRRFIADAAEARRHRHAVERTLKELEEMPPYLKYDIGWPLAADKHEQR